MLKLVLSIFFISGIFFSSYSFNAFAQIDPSPLQLEELNLIDPDCTIKRVMGTSALIPFTLRAIYDLTTDRGNDVTHPIPEMVPTSQQTDQVFIFYTPHVEEYQIVVNLHYPSSKDRVFFYEYMKEGERLSSSQEKFTSKDFCIKFFIITREPEHIPTRQEIVGDIIVATEKIPALFSAFNQNTASNTQWQYAITVLAVGGFGISILSLAVMTRAVAPLREVRQDFESLLEMGMDKIPLKKDEEPVIKEKKHKYLRKFLRMKDDDDEDGQTGVQEEEEQVHVKERGSSGVELSPDPVVIGTAKKETELVSNDDVLIARTPQNFEQLLKEKIPEEHKPEQDSFNMTLEQLEQKIISSIDIKIMRGSFGSFTVEELVLVYESLSRQWRNSITDDNAKVLRVIHTEILKRSNQR